MRRLVLLLALVASASAAGAQGIVGYACLGGEYADRAEPHDATRALHSVHAVTTDGFGARYVGVGGRDVLADGIGATSILNDGALAWRTPTDRQVVVYCDGRLSVTRDGNRFRNETVRLAVEVGNETGDPGPLRYLNPSLPNVDKTGPDYEATMRLGQSVTSLRWRDFLPTDSAIAPRIFDVLDGRFPKRKGLVGSTAIKTPFASAELHGLIAEDLPFEETLGREVPTLRRQFGGATSITYRRVGVQTRLDVAQLARPSWSQSDVTGPDWSDTALEAKVYPGLQALGLSTVARFRSHWAAGPGLTDGSVLWGETWVFQRYASARVSGGPSGVGGTFQVRPVTIGHGTASLTAGAQADRQLPEATPGLPFWVSRGYRGLASDTTPFTLDGVPRPLESVSAFMSGGRWGTDAESMAEFWRSHFISGAVHVESRRGETVYLPAFRLAEDAVAVSGPVHAVAASGTVAEGEIQARWSKEEAIHDALPDRFTRVQGWVRARLVLAGDDAFRAARDREPALRLGALAEHSPDGKLNLNARLEWRSATRWEGWPDPDVPTALLLDLGGDYTFGAFTLTLTGRNVLGAPEQTHPLGATLDGRLFVRLAAQLGG